MGRFLREQVAASSGQPVHRLPLDREAAGWYGVSVLASCVLGFLMTMVPVTAARPFSVYASITAGFWLLVLTWSFHRVGAVAAYEVEGSRRLVLRHFWRDVEVDASDVRGVRLSRGGQRVPLLVIQRSEGDVRTRLLSPDQLESWLPGALDSLR